MKHYKHFSEKERETLYFYLLDGKKQKEIAYLLERSPSSISREIKRNSIVMDMTRWHTIKTCRKKYHYLADKAHKKYLERKSNVGQL
jgi:IS30 family transposase